MALQDLTPQLRTRLNRMERAVGWFMFLATALLLFGFGYYIYSTAKLKGWFKVKAPYYTYANTAKGLKVGDPVMLLGFPIGRITGIDAMPAHGPGSEHEVYIGFEVLEPDYDYIWNKGSRAKLTAADLLGKRVVEVTKGTDEGHSTFLMHPVENVPLENAEHLPSLDKFRLGEELYNGTNLVSAAWVKLTPELFKKAADLHVTNLWIIDTSVEKHSLTAMWNQYDHHYEPYEKFKNGKLVEYELTQDEEPALTDRAQALLTQVEKALPNFLAITNRINAILSNSVNLTSNLNEVAMNVRPTVSNLSVITANLRDPKGSLGEWIIPTNINQKLDATLDTTHKTIGDADTNLVILAESLTRSLNNLADITSNLNSQVQANSNMLKQISDIVVHTDEFVQGLKHHWLLRSAFKHKNTNAPPEQPPKVLRSPQDQSSQ
jgi:ABC-type transporter Mla subunit MlaD